jgi:hypothetical protein
MLPFNEIGKILTPEMQAQAGVAPLTSAVAEAEAIAGRYNPVGAHGMYQKGGMAPFGYSLPREMVGLPTTFDRTADVIGVRASEQIGGRRSYKRSRSHRRSRSHKRSRSHRRKQRGGMADINWSMGPGVSRSEADSLMNPQFRNEQGANPLYHENKGPQF